jgi:DNA-binding winged helix-turn-helix (wHTH) protein
MDPATQPPASVTFGRFRVLPHRRELLVDGRPIKLGGRAFDVLMALIEARGAVVAKDALMARVWPDRIVEENNLQAHLSALREAFGADRELVMRNWLRRLTPIAPFLTSSAIRFRSNENW